MIIDGVEINDDSDCYVIAEIGHNHQGSVAICKEMFDAAKWAGVNAVKLQKRDNKNLYTEAYYNSPYNSEHAFGKTYGEHREALEFSFEQYFELAVYAERLGLTFFATAFDIASADFLRLLDVPAYKICSGDLTNIFLIRHVAKFGKPVIISTGGSSLLDVVEGQQELHDCPHAIMQCTSGYPAKFEELNLRVLLTYRRKFPDAVIGWSSHDNGIAMAVAAYALGARIIEKHFTLNRTMKGTDQAMSLEPAGMRKMVRDLRRVRRALGDGIKRQYDSERAPLTKQRKNARGQIDGKEIRA